MKNLPGIIYPNMLFPLNSDELQWKALVIGDVAWVMK